MGLKNDVELLLINFLKAYNSLDASAEDYDTQLANLQNEYNLNLDFNQMANSKGIDPLSLDDIDSVRKRMLLNAKRDRKYAKQEKWSNAASGIMGEGLSLIGNVFNTLSQPDPNSLSKAKLSEKVAENAKINAELFALKQAAWEELARLALQSMKMSLQKQAIPGQGIPSGESQLAKQGMKIEYMNLFK